MQQTLLALLALSLSGLVTLNQSRNVQTAQMGMVENELSVMGAGVALHVIEMAGAKAFDENTKPAQVLAMNALPSSNSSFSSQNDLGSTVPTNKLPEKVCDLDEPWKTPACDDIDDVRMNRWQKVTYKLRNNKIYNFETMVEVDYVTSNDFSIISSTPTNFKRVRVRVRVPSQVTTGRNTDGFVVLERVFAYDARKTYDAAKAVYGNQITFTRP